MCNHKCSHSRDDSPARGIAAGILLSIPLWIIIGAALVFL